MAREHRSRDIPVSRADTVEITITPRTKSKLRVVTSFDADRVADVSIRVIPGGVIDDDPCRGTLVD